MGEGQQVSAGGHPAGQATGDAASRVAWVDYSKGFCAIAVVCLYATYYVQGVNGDKGWMLYWTDFAAPFRMPDFFLIAGLFLSRSLRQPWRVYLDRKVVHFAYFFILWTTLYFLLHSFGGAGDEEAGRGGYLDWYAHPFHMLWFIQILPVFFVVTRLLAPISPWIVFPIAAALEILVIDSGVKQIDWFTERYVYFYAGYAFAPLAFRIADWAAARRGLALAALGAWAVVNGALVLAGLSLKPGIGLVLGFAGASAVMVIGSLLSPFRVMAWLRYVGQNSIVLFLSFFLFTVATARVLRRFDLVDDIGTQQLIVIVVSIVVPLVLYRFFGEGLGRWLFHRPSWFGISGERAPRPLGTTPTPP